MPKNVQKIYFFVFCIKISHDYFPWNPWIHESIVPSKLRRAKISCQKDAAEAEYLIDYCRKTQMYNFIQWFGWHWIIFYEHNFFLVFPLASSGCSACCSISLSCKQMAVLVAKVAANSDKLPSERGQTQTVASAEVVYRVEPIGACSFSHAAIICCPTGWLGSRVAKS